MALYYTLIVECYAEGDAQNLKIKFDTLRISVIGKDISLVNIEIDRSGKYFYVIAKPLGFGYSVYGNDEALNKKEVRTEFEGKLYKTLSAEDGIRRALCDYEAQDYLLDIDFVNNVDHPHLLYDKEIERSKSKEKSIKTYLINPPKH